MNVRKTIKSWFFWLNVCLWICVAIVGFWAGWEFLQRNIESATAPPLDRQQVATDFQPTKNFQLVSQDTKQKLTTVTENSSSNKIDITPNPTGLSTQVKQITLPLYAASKDSNDLDFDALLIRLVKNSSYFSNLKNSMSPEDKLLKMKELQEMVAELIYKIGKTNAGNDPNLLEMARLADIQNRADIDIWYRTAQKKMEMINDLDLLTLEEKEIALNKVLEKAQQNKPLHIAMPVSGF